jgi:hypothetical protein
MVPSVGRSWTTASLLGVRAGMRVLRGASAELCIGEGLNKGVLV